MSLSITKWKGLLIVTKLLKSSAIRAFVFKMEKAGTPVSVTIDDLQAVKDYEERFGKVEIAGVLIDREIELKIARAWPDESGIDFTGQNGE